MTKQLYLIDYENAHWCGGQLNVCVWAEDEDDARCIASDHMEEMQYELFADEYAEEGDDSLSDESAVSINSVELFDENHEQWQFYLKPDQRASFYPTMGNPHD